MRLKSIKNLIRIITLVLASLFIFVSVIPYLIPVQARSAGDPGKPFPESSFLHIDDTYVHYRLFTPINTSPRGKIILVHGLGASTFSWRNNVNSLVDEGYITLLVDLPGFGYSDRATNKYHSQPRRSDLLWNLLDKVDATQIHEIAKMPWNLVGHSMGGGTVMCMAEDKPSRTNTITLVDGAVYMNIGTIRRLLLAYPPFSRLFQLALRHHIFKEPVLKKLVATSYGREPTEQEIKGYLEPLLLPGTDKSFVNMMKYPKNLSPESKSYSHHNILAVWGIKDKVVPVNHGFKVKEHLAETELKLIHGAAHCPMETHSTIFNRILIEFLNKNNHSF